MLYGLVISAQRLLELGADNDEIMDITKEEVSIKAYHTFWVFFNRWSLKNKDKVGLGDSRGWVEGLKE